MLKGSSANSLSMCMTHMRLCVCLRETAQIPVFMKRDGERERERECVHTYFPGQIEERERERECIRQISLDKLIKDSHVTLDFYIE